MLRTCRNLGCGLAIGLIGPQLGSCGSDPVQKPRAVVEIRVLSNRADLVSGGDALVEIILPHGNALGSLSVAVDGRDVTAAFRPGGAARVVGMLTGLKEGPNIVVARSNLDGAQLTITNHPVGGPIFSGPQVQPWICATPTAQPATGASPVTNVSGLSTPPVDAQCNAPAEYRLFYRTTAPCSHMPREGSEPCFKPYEPYNPPADLARIVTDHGVAAKYIVRVERGVVNRAIYDMAVLFDPTAPTPATRIGGWNHKLLWSFGGGAGTPHKQFPPNSTWQVDHALARGFMVAVSAHTDQALNSNHVVAAETVMMAKEHIIERYGVIRYTIGSGCSGGAIMQLQLASMYPGLLDGLQTACTYPDAYSTTLEVTDCVLLDGFFDSKEFAALTAGLTPAQVNAKKAAIAGHLDEKACVAWATSYGNLDAPGEYVSPRTQRPANNCRLPDALVYDSRHNPQGVRCSIPDHAIAIWGAMPGTRIARRTTDNVGVQYGLRALESRQISAEDFVVLNEKIGGSDLDANYVARRMLADPQALRIAYENGIIGDARQWAKVPIIDLRGTENSGIHMNWRAFAVRARLDRANGGHDNHVMWRYGPTLAPPPHLIVDSLIIVDKWLSAIEADRGDVPLERKVTRNRPVEAFDFCYVGTDYRTRVTDRKRCDADPSLKYFGSPRQVAGGPLTEDILKCQLKPLERSSYTTTFSAEQWSRLEKAFPGGVCDWSKPGVGMQHQSAAWRTYAQGPGGKPLPVPPASQRL